MDWCISAFLSSYDIPQAIQKRKRQQSDNTFCFFLKTICRKKTKSHVNEYKYDDIQKVLETGKYFFVFHDSESVSIVDKSHFNGDVESFSDFIKTKTQYKKIK